MDADDDSGRVNDHQILLRIDHQEAYDPAGTLGKFVIQNSLAAPVLGVEFRKIHTLAQALFRYGQKLAAVRSQLHADDLVALGQGDGFNAHAGSSGGPYVFLIKADHLAVLGRYQHIVLAVGSAYIDQLIAVGQRDRDQPVGADIGKLTDRGLLNGTAPGSHDQIIQILGLAVPSDNDNGRYPLLARKLQQVDDGRSLGGTPRLRNVVGFQLIDAAHVGIKQKIIQGRSHIQVLDIVIAPGLKALDALAAPVLALIHIQRRAFYIAEVGHGDHALLVDHHILQRQGTVFVGDIGAAGIGVLGLDDQQLFLDHAVKQVFVGQDCLVFLDLAFQIVILILQLFAFQTGQGLQTHIDNGLGLGIAEAEAGHQIVLSLLDRAGGADDGNDLVDDIDGLEQAFQDMGPCLGFFQIVLGPSGHNVLLMIQIIGKDLL